jgi:ABC-type phosphate/phosphonate transport system substrate-binding protein
VVLSPNSKSRTLQEQVAAATEVAERMTVTDLAAAHDDVEPADLLVALVMARPEIKSVTDLAGKNVAMDERYSASSVDVWVGFVVAGRVSVEVSTGHTAAIDRLSNGEVAAAVLALVSADAADGFPEIAGFKIFRVPLWPYPSKARP